MRGNSHVRFGAGDEETCLGNGVRRFIPILPGSPAFLSLYGRDGGGWPQCPGGQRPAGSSSASAGFRFCELP
jgi:hypothetical protein